ncbi:hypothetical protein [Spongiimicrobium sp. 2-473A-2-J]|uniref:hypothetical protein n=1 Tax=Eudoraea algarum TaxID=3417568 RepID=UPI003D3648A9
MRNELKILAMKLDKVLEQQELILKALDNKVVLDSSRRIPSKQERRSKIKMEIQQQLREMFTLRPYKIKLKKEFNLKAQPHASR